MGHALYGYSCKSNKAAKKCHTFLYRCHKGCLKLVSGHEVSLDEGEHDVVPVQVPQSQSIKAALALETVIE